MSDFDDDNRHDAGAFHRAPPTRTPLPPQRPARTERNTARTRLEAIRQRHTLDTHRPTKEVT